VPHQDTIAAFDFDGTLTTADSLMRFLVWRRGPARFAADMLVTSPLLALYAARLVGNETHKLAMFRRGVGGMLAVEYERAAHAFAETRIPPMIRPEAMRRVEFHRARHHRVVIVTASPIDWIAPWAASEGFDAVLGNRAEVVAGRVTGRLEGVNCHGPEKLSRLLATSPARETFTLIAYGDSRGDTELLAAADEAYYRRFA
jgi:HAD superfamily hydrolase (TIGR01490 family)